MTYMPAIIERLDIMGNILANFGQTEILNPLKEDNAQNGSGAENREPETV